MDKSRDTKKVLVGAPVAKKNDQIAAETRQFLNEKGIFTINIISSPGSGKTTLLERMAAVFGPDMAAIEGDVQTRRDAERVARAGCRVHQIETGGSCHLNAQGVADAIDELGLADNPCKVLVIENVGNLVCPSGTDLGEHMKVAILSLPEGDDKVLKYPAIFSRIGALVINKIDLAEVMDFDVDRAIRECASLNDRFEAFRVSAKTGEGVEAFCRFLRSKAAGSHA